MIPDVVLELSTEQLISALNKKLSMECASIQPATPPVPRALVTTLAAEIDTLEKQAKEILHRIACLRNPLQPINRLPLDIIARFAAFIPRTNPEPVVSLTHVCRYWREAIISSHENWALIGNGWKRLVPLCLERAGTTPLTVNISISNIKKSKDFLQALFPHISRISHLSLTGCSSASLHGVAKPLTNFLASPMLNLTSLELESPHLTQLPLHPLLANINSLVELKLGRCSFPLQQFIGFLESNLNLEVVDLDIALISSPESTVPERGFSLPRLQRLVLTCDNATDSRALLSSLSFPHGVNIEVYESERNSCGDLVSFLPSPPTPIQDLLDPITTIKHLVYKGGLHLFGNDASLSFDGHTAPRKSLDVFDMFATSTVREFHLHLYPKDLVWPLERLPALEALVISKSSPGLGSLFALKKEPIPCLSLKTIAFFDCGVTLDTIKELEGVLTKREHSTAARLHRVMIVNHTCDFPGVQLISRLQRSVQRVDVIMSDKLPDLL